MIRECFFVFSFSFMQLGVLSDKIPLNVECGEDGEITLPCDDTLSCNRSSKIIKVVLKNDDFTFLNITDISDVERCSEDGKFCFKVAKDGKPKMTVRKSAMNDSGAYYLYIVRDDKKRTPTTVYITVKKGDCEPMLSSSKDELTCEVNCTFNTTMVWKYNEAKKSSESTTGNLLKLKLTDETREMKICCFVSYEKNGKPFKKQNCTNGNPPDLNQIQRLNAENDTETTKTIIPISCFSIIGIGVAIYFIFRRRLPIISKRRARTFSEQGLLEPVTENTETTISEPLQSPQEQV